MNKISLILIAAVVSLGAGILVRQGSVEKVNQPLLSFTLPDASGTEHAISEWQGKVLVINFWATWCPPCKKEIPEFVALQNRYAAEGLQFIGVAIDEKESVVEYLSTIKINYPILIGTDQGINIAHNLGNISATVPFTIVVDARGQIIHRQSGEFSKSQLVEIIEPLLANFSSAKKH